jgi:hypothetical protein
MNAIIDSILHPFAKRDGRILVVDGILHALVEKNPPSSLGKFLMYSMPKILSETKTDVKQRNEMQLALKEMMKLTRRLRREAKTLKKTNRKAAHIKL